MDQAADNGRVALVKACMLRAATTLGAARRADVGQTSLKRGCPRASSPAVCISAIPG